MAGAAIPPALPQLPESLLPVWQLLAAECSQTCLSLFRPHLAALLRAGDGIAGQHGLEQLRALFRCVGQLHGRAERAEATARHWEAQWAGAFQHALQQRSHADQATAGYQVELRDAHQALSAMRTERDRLVAEIHHLREEAQKCSSHEAVREQDRGVWVRSLEETMLRRVGESEDQQRALQRRCDERGAAVAGMQAELGQLRLELAFERSERRRLDECAAEAGRYALEARSQVSQHISSALEAQERKLGEKLRREQEAHAKSVAGAVTRQEALGILTAYAELWRTGATPVPGIHGQRADRAVRELMKRTDLLPPDGELVQEPLRRALGDRGARELGAALVVASGRPAGPLLPAAAMA